MHRNLKFRFDLSQLLPCFLICKCALRVSLTETLIDQLVFFFLFVFASFDKLLNSFPSDFVLCTFFDETDSFKDVSDVVDSSFLNIEACSCFVEVSTFIFWSLDKSDELSGQLAQRIVLSRLACERDCEVRSVRTLVLISRGSKNWLLLGREALGDWLLSFSIEISAFLKKLSFIVFHLRRQNFISRQLTKQTFALIIRLFDTLVQRLALSKWNSVKRLLRFLIGLEMINLLQFLWLRLGEGNVVCFRLWSVVYLVQERARKAISKRNRNFVIVTKQPFNLFCKFRYIDRSLFYRFLFINMLVWSRFLLNFLNFGLLNVLDRKDRGLFACLIYWLRFASFLSGTVLAYRSIFRHFRLSRLLNNFVYELLFRPEVSGGTAELAMGTLPLQTLYQFLFFAQSVHFFPYDQILFRRSAPFLRLALWERGFRIHLRSFYLRRLDRISLNRALLFTRDLLLPLLATLHHFIN